MFSNPECECVQGLRDATSDRVGVFLDKICGLRTLSLSIDLHVANIFFGTFSLSVHLHRNSLEEV